MQQSNAIVRAILQEDDVERIEALYYDTNWSHQSHRFADGSIAYRKTDWRGLLFPATDTDRPIILSQLVTKGYAAFVDGKIEAFATVGISPATGNGYLEYGCSEEGRRLLDAVIAECELAVRAAGGTQLYYTISMQLGEIRNERISFFEANGFACSPYYHVFADHRNIAEWSPPDELDLSRIRVADEATIAQIASLLDEDGEMFLAEEYRGQFAEHTPDHVFLCLYDQDGHQIQGIAYYKIWEKQEGFLAVMMGLHIRPRASIETRDIRLLLHAAIASLQQLGVTAAWSRMSSQCFELILEAYAAGFRLAPTHTLVMSKSV
jgi:hypothetical protein